MTASEIYMQKWEKSVQAPTSDGWFLTRRKLEPSASCSANKIQTLPQFSTSAEPRQTLRAFNSFMKMMMISWLTLRSHKFGTATNVSNWGFVSNACLSSNLEDSWQIPTTGRKPSKKRSENVSCQPQINWLEYLDNQKLLLTTILFE